MVIPEMRKIENKSECIFAIHVKSKKPLLTNESETFVESKCCRIIEFSFEDDLDGKRMW